MTFSCSVNGLPGKRLCPSIRTIGWTWGRHDQRGGVTQEDRRATTSRRRRTSGLPQRSRHPLRPAPGIQSGPPRPVRIGRDRRRERGPGASRSVTSATVRPGSAAWRAAPSGQATVRPSRVTTCGRDHRRPALVAVRASMMATPVPEGEHEEDLRDGGDDGELHADRTACSRRA